jgi:hypothetical protein
LGVGYENHFGAELGAKAGGRLAAPVTNRHSQTKSEPSTWRSESRNIGRQGEAKPSAGNTPRQTRRNTTANGIVGRRKAIGDVNHLKVFANEDAAEKWFEENDPEGVAFEYEVLE